MQQTNVRDYMPELSKLYPDLDPKGMSALCNYFFRMLQDNIVRMHEVELRSKKNGFSARIYIRDSNVARANKHAGHRRVRKDILRRKIASAPKCKPGEKFRLKKKDADS